MSVLALESRPSLVVPTRTISLPKRLDNALQRDSHLAVRHAHARFRNHLLQGVSDMLLTRLCMKIGRRRAPRMRHFFAGVSTGVGGVSVDTSSRSHSRVRGIGSRTSQRPRSGTTASVSLSTPTCSWRRDPYLTLPVSNRAVPITTSTLPSRAIIVSSLTIAHKRESSAGLGKPE